MSFARTHWKQLLAAAVVVTLAVVFWQPLYGWFFEAKGKRTVATGGHDHGAEGADAGAAAHRFNDGARQALQVAYSGYEHLRSDLAEDKTSRLPEIAPPVAQTIREALGRDPNIPGRLAEELTASAAAAEKLGQTKDAKAARNLFGELSKGLVSAALEDPRLADGWSLFECPMAEGYQRWLQPEPQMANPYMGTRMLKCGTTLNLEAEAEAHQQAVASAGDPNEIAYYTCPMHPGVKQSENTPCPICGMDLVPVTRGDLESGVVTVDELRRQKIGVKVEEVKRVPMTVKVRTVGEVKYDETRLTDVSLKVGGWIRGLKVDATGQPVKKGDVLFHLYSPELFAAQQEYLLALRAAGGNENDSLVRASRQRLSLWDIGAGQLDALAKRGEPTETLPIRAPASGFVIEKMVVEGGSVEPGMKLYRIAGLDRVWVETQVYEADLPHAKVGTKVQVTLPFAEGKAYEGKISYVYPYMQGATRTGVVRVELANPDGLLKPEMYADVTFTVDRGEKLQVPAAAIIYTGPRRLVFVDLGEGRLRPREVKLGARSGGAYEVLEGLEPGERVVTSGNFLVAAESRLRSATEYWGGELEGEDAKAPVAPSPAPAQGGGGHVH